MRSSEFPASEADLTPSGGYRPAVADPVASSDGVGGGILMFDQARYDAVGRDEAVQLLSALRRPDEPPFLQTFADGPEQLFARQVITDRHGQDRVIQKFCVDGIPTSVNRSERMTTSVSLCGWHTLAALAARPYAIQNSSARIGVFFCVNALDPKIKRRNSDTVRRVVALVLDLDGKPLPPKGFPLQPTAIVETSPGRYHVYAL